MQRLGYWHVYTCMGDPHGLSFSLDLYDSEQKDIARELVRMAVKETMRARMEARRSPGMAGVSEGSWRARALPACAPFSRHSSWAGQVTTCRSGKAPDPPWPFAWCACIQLLALRRMHCAPLDVHPCYLHPPSTPGSDPDAH